MADVNFEVAKNNSPKNNRKIIVGVVLFISAVLLGLGGYFAYQTLSLQATLRTQDKSFAEVPGIEIFQVPATGTAEKYRVEGTSDTTVTVTWWLDCWDLSVCKSEIGQQTLKKGESFEKGFGAICSKWGFFLTTAPVNPMWSKVEDIPDNFPWQWEKQVEKASNCSAAQPTPTTAASPTTPQSYTAPEYPTCPAGMQRFTATGDLLNQSGSNVKTHTLTSSAAVSLSKITGLKKEGHPEELCVAGPNNDNGKYPCDQGQLNEGFKIYVNNVLVATVNDEGAGKDDQWFPFEKVITPVVNLVAGANTIKFEHIGGTGPGSVEYKASLCYAAAQATATPTSVPTASPTNAPSATPTASPSPTSVSTATPTPTSAPTATPTVSPVPTQVASATTTPAPGATNPPTSVANVTNPPQSTENKVVASAEKLPSAGTTENTIIIALTACVLISGGVILSRKRKFF